jgi:AdoMet-dependent heme synthase
MSDAHPHAGPHHPGGGSGRPNELRLLFWESTARCNLHCAHCRRTDITPETTAFELSTAQARTMMDQAATLGKPIIVFSGGEPLLRPDWPELAAHAKALGLPVALATNGTLVDAAMAGRIAQAGFHRVSISLDAPDAATHDSFRGDAGAFDAALAGIGHLRSAGVPVQINSTVYAGNLYRLDEVYELAVRAGAMALHLFVLVPVGCGLELAEGQQLTTEQAEEVMLWVCRRASQGRLELKATCAPQFHRVARQWLAANEGTAGAENVRAMLRGRGCLAGVGVVFVSHSGEVFPCGYLPQSCGNVLRQDLGTIWRESAGLNQLRRQDEYQGKCGACEYKMTCGGCRARAYAQSGNMLTADPICGHQPVDV